LGAAGVAPINRRFEGVSVSPSLKAVLSGIAAGAMLGCCAASAAGSPKAPDAQVGDFRIDDTLAQLGAAKGLRLTGTDGRQTLTLSIPPDRVVAHAHMDLRYHLSPGLLPRISQVNVWINNQLVRSLPVEAPPVAGDAHDVQFDIDPKLLGEYNQVQFQLVGHYTLQCEDPANSTLWATISPRTRLTLDGPRLAMSDDLHRLPAPFFYPSMHQGLSLPVVFAATPDTRTLQAAGVATSWFGALAGYRGASFPVSVGTIPEHGNAVVLALNGGSALAGQPTGDGPTVSETTNPNDPYGKLLWLTGDDARQLVTAAQGLVTGAATVHGGAVRISDLDLPAPSKPDAAPRWVPDDGPVRLGALANWNPMSIQGGTGSLPFTFYLPPSLFFWDSPGVPLHLHYGYNPLPIEPNSSLNLQVNGAYARALPLLPGKDQRQEVRSDWAMSSSLLTPYANALDATFYFAPIKGKCTTTDLHNAAGTIYPDSTIDIHGIPHYARLPDLSLLRNGGYPFTRYADLSRTAVVLPADADTSLLQAYLDLVGLFGRQTGAAALRLAVVHPAQLSSVADRDLVVFAPPGGKLMGDWGAHLPLTLQADAVHLNDLGGWFGGLRERLPWWDAPPAQYGRAALGKVLAAGAPGAVIEAAESPLHGDRGLVLFSASSSAGWSGLIKVLTGSDNQNRVFGDLALVDDARARSFVLPAPHYFVGHLPPWTWLRYHLSRHPWIIPLVLIPLALLLAWIAGRLLRRRAARRLAGWA
jgi:Bacterial cellulose synthase subunit.